MGTWEPDGRQTIEVAPAATFQVGFPLDGTTNTEALLEQEQGVVLLPGQGFGRREKNARPGYLEAAQLDKFSQGCLTIDVEMPLELFQDGLHVPRATESTVEILAEAHRIHPPQILPMEAAGKFPQDALEEEAVRR